MEVVVKSIPVYYEEFGRGIPILMLHGWPGDHRHMVTDMEPLFKNRAGWRRIYPDLPGMGKTPGKEEITNQDAILEIVSEFMQTVAPNERFVVAGHSYGGYLCHGLTYRQPKMIDGVFLFAPPIEADSTKRPLPPHQVLVEDPQFLAVLTAQENDVRNIVVVQSLDILEWFRTNGTPAFSIADYTFLGKLSKNFAFSFPVNQLTTPFSAPTLILTGRQDSVSGYRDVWAILENYPRATFVVLDRAGHWVHKEQKGLFHSLASEWLNRVEEYIAKPSS